MGFADEQSYEEVVSQLQRFVKEVEDECNVMTRAGMDCVDNMDNDPAALASCTKLAECIKSIEMNVELVEQVIKALQEQIQGIREKAAKASQSQEVV